MQATSLETLNPNIEIQNPSTGSGSLEESRATSRDNLEYQNSNDQNPFWILQFGFDINPKAVMHERHTHNAGHTTRHVASRY